MAGAELLGASGPKADAELIHLACSGLQELGIRDYRLVIGITDVLEGYLRKLGLRKQLLNFLLRNMENLRKRGLTDVLESLRAIYPEFEIEDGDRSGASGSEAENSQQLISVLREMSDGEAHQAITDFLHSLNIRIDTNRVEGEVIDRLLHKIRGGRAESQIEGGAHLYAASQRTFRRAGCCLAGHAGACRRLRS